jgi:hypothetical protein
MYRVKGMLMSDADVPWSSPPKGGSSGAMLSSSTSPANVKAPVQWTAAHESAHAAFMQAYGVNEDKKTEHGQQQSVGGELPPAFYVPTSVSLQDGGPVAPDMSEMLKHIEEVAQVRDQERKELYRRHGEEAFNEGAGRIINGALARGAGAGKMADGIANAAGVVVASGAHAHHSEQQHGWAEAGRAVEAGAFQHETEERRRNDGMSL